MLRARVRARWHLHREHDPPLGLEDAERRLHVRDGRELACRVIPVRLRLSRQYVFMHFLPPTVNTEPSLPQRIRSPPPLRHVFFHLEGASAPRLSRTTRIVCRTSLYGELTLRALWR